MLQIKKFKKRILLFAFAFLLLVLISLPLLGARATNYSSQRGSSDNTLWGQQANNIQNRAGLGNDDPREIVANIINITLGFLGILAILIIIYAGFLWMMSGGNPDKITKARKTLVGGVIGLIIVLSAFAIAAFILDAIFRATTGSATAPGGIFPGPPGGGGGGGGGGSYTQNYPCSTQADTCSPSDALCTFLGPYFSCNPFTCNCEVLNSGSCYNADTNICDIPCRIGLECLGASGCYDNDSSDPRGSCGMNDQSCYCCCDPGSDHCGDIYPSLYCQANTAPCDGGARGLCCGCSSDTQCGNPLTTACSSDTCCRARPNVLATVPPDGETDVCTNLAIQIQFDQGMLQNSLNDNILILGEYTTPCPAGMTYVTKGPSMRKYSEQRELSNGVDFFNILKSLQTKTALAQPINFCAQDGSARVQNSNGNNYVYFYPGSFLDTDTLYHILVVGDNDLLNDIDEGVLSYWEVGMNGPVAPVYNGVNYTNSFISSFTTMPDLDGLGGVCLIENVVLRPSSYLFQISEDSAREVDDNPNDPTFDSSADRDRLFVAKAFSNDGQLLASVPGYQWDWNMFSTVAAVVDDDAANPALYPGNMLVEVQDGITDGRSTIIAQVDMSAYAGTNFSMEGDGMTDSSNVYVFICDNPWPPIVNGTWEPWHDPNGYNFDVYYCRDTGSVGTIDDLPSFDPTAVQGGADPLVLSQYYFVYEDPPAPGIIATLVNTPGAIDGGSIDFSWSGVSGAAGYTLYWGNARGAYSSFEDVGNVTNYTLSGLDNERLYYFNVTAYSAERAESSFFGEVSTTTRDTVGPVLAPTFIIATTTLATEVSLSWSEVDGADSYIISYGSAVGPPFGFEEDLGNSTNVIINGLTPESIYYFGVQAADNYGNGSPYGLVNLTMPTE